MYKKNKIIMIVLAVVFCVAIYLCTFGMGFGIYWLPPLQERILSELDPSLAGGFSCIVQMKDTDASTISTNMNSVAETMQIRMEDAGMSNISFSQLGESKFLVEADYFENGNLDLSTYLGDSISVEWRNAQDEVLFTLDDVSDVAILEGDTPGITYTMGTDAKDSYKEISTEYAASGEVLSVWINGNHIGDISFDAAVEDGKGTITGENLTADDAQRYASQMLAGNYTAEFTITSVQNVSLELAAQTRQIFIAVSLILLVASIVILFVLFKKEALMPTVSLLSLLMLTLFCIGTLPSVHFSIFSFIGLIIAFIWAFYLETVAHCTMKSLLSEGKSKQTAVGTAYQKILRRALIGTITGLLITALCFLIGAEFLCAFGTAFGVCSFAAFFSTQFLTRYLHHLTIRRG